MRVTHLALATVNGGMIEVQLIQDEAPLSPWAEKVRLSARKAEIANTERDFELILSGLKSECVLSPFLDDPERHDLGV
ncbi:unnamed protein product [Eruca vesicaria subsp. sativa]|uniref:Uncharacterized protein n=1 Tax=Eruca vesicaria subsp. sativa TaxID=29727 RepID=A0ABC8K3D0_ERUVS|nr:unnamed protein product [Eruca vesicaria subsp. sativa]